MSKKTKEVRKAAKKAKKAAKKAAKNDDKVDTSSVPPKVPVFELEPIRALASNIKG